MLKYLNVYYPNVIKMVGKDAGFLKMQRIQKIKKEMAKSISKGLDKNRLLDWIEINLGLSRLTAEKYVGLIVRAQGWIENEGKILFEIAKV